METTDRYFMELATAFVRGRLGNPTATIDDGLRASRARVVPRHAIESMLDIWEIPDVTEAPLVEWWENDDGLVRR